MAKRAQKSERELREDAGEVEEIVRDIAPLLHGREPNVTGAVLGELLAMLLAGHQGPDAAKLRRELLTAHIKLVRRLTPIYDQRIRKMLFRQ